MRFFSFNLELICTSEYFNFLKNSLVQINSKLNEKNRMITYTFKKQLVAKIIFECCKEQVNYLVFLIKGSFLTETNKIKDNI